MRSFLLQSITGRRIEVRRRDCTLPCFQHPRQAFASNVSGNLVIAFELAERDVVTIILEARRDAPATTIDWKNVIVRAV